MRYNKIDFLGGQVSALEAAFLALASIHPAKIELMQEFERLSEKQIGITTPIAVSESYIAGQRQTIDEIRGFLASKAL